jgi:hypothetical protein
MIQEMQAGLVARHGYGDDGGLFRKRFGHRNRAIASRLRRLAACSIHGHRPRIADAGRR